MSRWSIALTLVEGIGPARANRLIGEFGGAEAIFSNSTKSIVERTGISYTVASRLKYDIYAQRVDEIIDWCMANSVTVLDQNSLNYPPLLKEIYDPPIVLYAAGDLTLLNSRRLVAIVGTRIISKYGKDVVVKFVKDFVEASVVTVSGLAKGIDTVTHSATLDFGGGTIAVLPIGLDRVYPAENRELAGLIKNRGLIISEYPPGSSINRYCFVQRNRVISGVASATVVVEAAKKSGSLITADFALSQGRELFAVPGSIFSENSLGTNSIIANGATPALSSTIILDAVCGEIATTAGEAEQLSFFDAVADNLVDDSLSDEELTLYKELKGSRGLRIDELEEALTIPFDRLFELLLSLEMAELIEQKPGGIYCCR